MQIREITVGTGRVFNHPHESYSNLRPSVVLKATVDEGEDPELVARKLQGYAEDLIEDHKRAILAKIDRDHRVETARYSISDAVRHHRLGRTEPSAFVAKLDAIAAEFPELAGDAEMAKATKPGEKDEDDDLF